MGTFIPLSHLFSQLPSFWKVKSVSRFSCVRFFVTPHGLSPARLLCPWNSPGENTGVGSHSLLQGLFLTPGSSLHLLYSRWILYHLSHQGSPPNISRRCFLLCHAFQDTFLCFLLKSHIQQELSQWTEESLWQFLDFTFPKQSLPKRLSCLCSMRLSRPFLTLFQESPQLQLDLPD